MKIVAHNGQTLAPAAETRSEAIKPAVSAAVGTAAGAGAAPAALESSVLQPAKAALDALPEIDAAKVAALREALARGEINFDAKRLAQLIQRFHGGRA
jgi:negative regulator of flagellin synthesis FlgM